MIYSSGIKTFLFFLMVSSGLCCSSLGANNLSHGVKAPLKILVSVGYFPVLSETFIVNHLTGLIDRGHNITIHAHSPFPNSKMHPKITEYELLKKVYYKKLPSDIHEYDVILCEFGVLGDQFVRIKREKNLKAKIVTCFRGYDISGHVKSEGPKCYANLFSCGDLFLPASHYFVPLLTKMGCDLQKITVQLSSIDLDKFKLRTDFSDEVDKVRILTVSRLVEKKGTIYAIKAIAQLVNKYPNLEYVVVGDGNLKEKLKAEIRHLGMENRIKLLGWGNQDDVIHELNKADIFVLPSITATNGDEEGIPNALKEAMAVGLPVVSTEHAGISELVQNNESGFLVKQRDAEMLADRIEQLIVNPQLRRDMGRAGRAAVENTYDNDMLNDRLEQLLYQLMGV